MIPDIENENPVHMSALETTIRQYMLMIRKIQDTPDAIRLCDDFLDAARSFETVKWALSRKYANIYRCEIQFCFENCQKIAVKMPALAYCEGYVVLKGEQVEDHAWLVDEMNEVIDPTLALNHRLREMVEGYMGVRIPMDYVSTLFLKDGIRGPRIEQAFADGMWRE